MGVLGVQYPLASETVDKISKISAFFGESRITGGVKVASIFMPILSNFFTTSIQSDISQRKMLLDAGLIDGSNRLSLLLTALSILSLRIGFLVAISF